MQGDDSATRACSAVLFGIGMIIQLYTIYYLSKVKCLGSHLPGANGRDSFNIEMLSFTPIGSSAYAPQRFIDDDDDEVILF
jgi:hypothetical protein